MSTKPRALACLVVVLSLSACASETAQAPGRDPPPPGSGDAPPTTTAPADEPSASAAGDESPSLSTESTVVDTGGGELVPRVVEVSSDVVEEPSHDQPVRHSDGERPIAEGKDPRAFIFDRVILKPKKGELVDKEGVRAVVARTTGAEVSDVKAGPRGTFLVVFAPADPPRDAAAQTALVKRLLATGSYEYVEADRIMTAR